MTVGVRDGVGVPVGVRDGVIVTVGVDVGVIVIVGVGVPVDEGAGVGDWVGMTGGSSWDEAFWGSEFCRWIKSSALWSVSSPLPLNSSVPPGFRVSQLEPAVAFRSMLLADDEEEGVATGLPSAVSAVPYPTRSTGRLSVAFFKMTVLLSEMEFAEYAILADTVALL